MSTAPHKIDKAKLLQAIEEQRNLMIAVATGGPAIVTANYEYGQRRFAIKQALGELGIKDPNPYTDSWDWYRNPVGGTKKP